MKPQIIAVEFNLHFIPDPPMLNREIYQVGETEKTYIPTAISRKCIFITQGKDDIGIYVEARFNDDTFDRVYSGISRIVYAEENAFNRIIGEDNEIIKSE